MKLASLDNCTADGRLIVVNQAMSHYAAASNIPTLQYALEHWKEIRDDLQVLSEQVNQCPLNSLSKLDTRRLRSPLPRAYQWLDGSAYLSHVRRVRRARGAEMPENLLYDPLMYQGGSDYFLSPQQDICLQDPEWGLDFEAEVAVVVDNVPQGTPVSQASSHIILVMLVNDISLRNLIPPELSKGFGFLHGKPPSAFSPMAVTVDELGSHWRDNKLHLSLCSYVNERLYGNPNAGVDMQFDFAQLIHHACRTRPLSAGTIIGSGTVSNNDPETGCSCIVERRVIEIADTGTAHSQYLNHGDRIKIEMLDSKKQSLFGAIEQEIIPCQN